MGGSSTAAARAAVNTARATKPAVAAIEATTTAAQAKSAGMKESFGDTTLGGTAVQAAVHANWMEVTVIMAAVGMAERAASHKARERAVRGQKPAVSATRSRGDSKHNRGGSSSNNVKRNLEGPQR